MSFPRPGEVRPSSAVSGYGWQVRERSHSVKRDCLRVNKGRKTTGWGIELKEYNMPNMKEFKLSRMHIVTGVIGGFVIGLGSGYAL